MDLSTRPGRLAIPLSVPKPAKIKHQHQPLRSASQIPAIDCGGKPVSADAAYPVHSARLFPRHQIQGKPAPVHSVAAVKSRDILLKPERVLSGCRRMQRGLYMPEQRRQFLLYTAKIGKQIRFIRQIRISFKTDPGMKIPFYRAFCLGAVHCNLFFDPFIKIPAHFCSSSG